MKFRTELEVQSVKELIDLNDPLMTIGSCFADDIGTKFKENKFHVYQNPFGTIYNPISIHKLLNMVVANGTPDQNGFIERDGFFYHHDFHSDWYGKSQADLQGKLIDQLQQIHGTFQSCKFLFITYGTSMVYEERKSKEVVSNCHKRPQINFERFLLTQKRIIESFEEFYKIISKFNKDCHVILTVSPVRHLKDSLELNSVSKSTLRLVCHTLSEAYNGVSYFPAYEIMMDDLRDYRFYQPDMIHPAAQAVDYIWDKFSKAHLNKETIQFVIAWSKIIPSLKHKPFHPESESHQKFIKEILVKLEAFSNRIDVSNEIQVLKDQLI